MSIEDKIRSELVGIYADLELDALLENIAEKIKKYLDCEEASIFLYNKEREELYFETATGSSQSELKKIIIKKGEGAAGWIAENCKNLIINDPGKDNRFENLIDEKTKFKTKSILGAPIISNSELIGVVEAINKRSDIFSDRDEKILDIFSSYISIPLQNAILFRKTVRESKEKGLLIKLGKIVSSSFDYEEVFNVLKKIITENISAKEINVMVNSTGKLYKLCENSDEEKSENTGLTRIEKNSAMFPLRTEDKITGFLEIKSESPIPESFISLLRGLSIYTAISINKYEMYCELIEKERIEKELQIARQIQQSFLLSEKKELRKMDYCFVNIPSSKVGGDYYDIVSLENEDVIFTINDIAGHGIPASLLMSVFRTNFTYRIKRDQDIAKTMQYLNDLIAETTETNLYLTSFTVKINKERKQLEYLNCGHNPQFIVRGKSIIDLNLGTTVVGMFPGIETPLYGIDLKRGDIIVLFTDGVIEEEDRNEKQFSTNRLKEIISKNSKLPADDIKDILIEALEKHSRGDKFNDDITFMLIKIV